MCKTFAKWNDGDWTCRSDYRVMSLREVVATLSDGKQPCVGYSVAQEEYSFPQLELTCIAVVR